MALLKLAKNWLGAQWGTRSRNIDDASVPHGIDGPLSSCDISPVAKGWSLLPMRLYTLHFTNAPVSSTSPNSSLTARHQI